MQGKVLPRLGACFSHASDQQCSQVFCPNLVSHSWCVLPGPLDYAPLPEGPEDARQTELDQQLEQLPQLRKAYKMQARIFCDEDHYMARKARALGFSEP